MALKKPAKFENEETSTATMEDPADQGGETQASAKVEPTHATARAASTSVAAAGNGSAEAARKFKKEVETMKGASDFSYGNYPVFKGGNGEIAGGEGDKLGRWAQVRLLSWDDHYEISPGEKGNSTKDFVAYSKDGETIDYVIGEELKEWVGKPAADYLDYLRSEEEFKNVKVRKFVDTACALMATDSGDGPIGTVIQITLSESSISSFSRYQSQLIDTARCVEMGLPGFTMPEDPFTFYFLREVATKGDNSWTKLKIVSVLPNKL